MEVGRPMGKKGAGVGIERLEATSGKRGREESRQSLLL